MLNLISFLEVWLHQPGNIEILKMFGGAIASAGGAIWGVFTYLQNRKLEAMKQEIEELRRARIQSDGHASAPKVSTLARVGLALAVLVTFAGAAYGYYGFNQIRSTITTTHHVCVGEHEKDCGFSHDARLACYEDVATKWAAPKCLKYTTRIVSAHDGGRCGYMNVEVLCTQSAP